MKLGRRRQAEVHQNGAASVDAVTRRRRQRQRGTPSVETDRNARLREELSSMFKMSERKGGKGS